MIYVPTVHRFTIPVDNIDMKKINDFFQDADHMNRPNPKKLQQTVLFYLIYYTCRRGLENLDSMKMNHYKVSTEPDGTSYVFQNTNELDKNHCEDCTDMVNDWKMYANPGKNE